MSIPCSWWRRRRWHNHAARPRVYRFLAVRRLEDRTLISGSPLANAVFLPFTAAHTAHAAAFLATPDEVDLYKVSLGKGDEVSATISAQTSGSGLLSVLRVFDTTGKQLALDDQEGGDPLLNFQVPAAGNYFIGVSSAADDAYDPTTANSGQGGVTTGLYSLDLRLVPGAPLLADLTGGSFRLGANSDTVAYGDNVSGTFTVENRGGGNATSFTVELVLSSSPRFDGFSPRQVLTPTFQTQPPPFLAADGNYTTQFSVPLPASAPAGFAASGPVDLRLLIVPGSSDSSTTDKSGVHRGEDWETLTIVTPVPTGTTDLASVDPNLNTRIDGTLSGPVQVSVYSLAVSDVIGTGMLTASVARTSGTLVPQLTLSTVTGQVLNTSDAGPMVQNLTPGTYILAVSVQAGAGAYQLTTEFVPGSSPSAPLGVGQLPYSVAVADVNGDGRPDLVTANPSSDTVSVLLGNGDGTFQAQQTFQVGAFPGSVAVADVNGDGRPDLVTANGDFGDGTVSVLLGNGDGTFQAQQTFQVGSRPYSVAVADVNGDGRPDLVIANDDFGDGTVSVLLGNGDGTFQAQQTFQVGSQPYSVAVADVNGDGRPDLVTANHSSDTVSVLLGNGDGTFQAQQTFQVGSLPRSVAVADVNGDGRPDIITANSGDGTVSVLLGNGDGTFQAQQTFQVGSRPDSVAVADVNGDGRPDLVTANGDFGANTVSVLLGNGDGTFQAQQTFQVGSRPDSVAVADVNGDGRPDLVTANPSSDTVSVLLGNGDGTFQAQQTFQVGSLPRSVAVADVNGDGRPDLVTANDAFGDGTVSVLLGNGDGTFQAQQTFQVGSLPRSVAVADVNGDGRPDLVTANARANTVSVLLGNGNGTFNPAAPSNGGSLRNTPYVADLNGDSLPDSVILDGSGNILVRQGLPDPNNPFAPPVTINAPVVYNQAETAAIVAAQDQFLLPGYHIDPSTGELEGPISAVDLTVLQIGTGRQVIATANATPDLYHLATTQQFLYSVSLYSRAADGTFLRITAFSTPLLPTRIVAGDLTGNGLDDLVVANALDNTIQVVFQNSDPTFVGPIALSDKTFSAPITLPTGETPSDISLVDVNGDGLLDIVVTDQASGDVTVFLNQGNRSFAPPERFRAGTGLYGLDTTSATPAVSSLAQTVALAAGNFTGDGRKDLVVINRGAHSFSVLPNDGNGGVADPHPARITSPTAGLSINNQPGPVVTDDFHGADGQDSHRAAKADLAILMEDQSQVWIYTNNGNGTFTLGQQIPVGSEATGLSVVPDSRAGLFDLLVGNQFGDILRLQGIGNGTFQPPPDKSVSLDVTMVGGQPKVVLGNAEANHVVVESARPGTNTFVSTQPIAAAALTTPFAPQAVRWYPLDPNSSTPDAVVVASGSNRLQTYRFDSKTSTYVLTNDIPVGDDPVSVTIATLPGGNATDMFVANQGSNDVSVILGSIVNGQWVGTSGPRLNSSGTGPIGVTVVPDPNSPGGSDLAVTNGQSGTVALLPGVGQGFFNDQDPRTLTLGSPVVQAPVFTGTTGVAPTPTGQLIGFNLGSFTSLGDVFTPPPGQGAVDAVAALADGDLVAAEQGGTVLELNSAFQPVQELTPLNGIPTNPSALAVLDDTSGLQMLVTNAGQDKLFEYATGPFEPPTTFEPAPSIMLPPLVAQGFILETTTPQDAPLLLVVTLSGGLLPGGNFDLTEAVNQPAAESTDLGAAQVHFVADANDENGAPPSTEADAQASNFGLAIEGMLHQIDLYQSTDPQVPYLLFFQATSQEGPHEGISPLADFWPAPDEGWLPDPYLAGSPPMSKPDPALPIKQHAIDTTDIVPPSTAAVGDLGFDWPAEAVDVEGASPTDPAAGPDANITPADVITSPIGPEVRQVPLLQPVRQWEEALLAALTASGLALWLERRHGAKPSASNRSPPLPPSSAGEGQG